MGLDTSHDCWHGSYGNFARFREKLNEVAGYGNSNDFVGFGGVRKWPNDDPLTLLLDHSDCDGEILWSDAQALADRLTELLPAMCRADYEEKMRSFITGLHRAVKTKENVEFH